MFNLFEERDGYRYLKFSKDVNKILVIRAFDTGVYADAFYGGGRCVLDTDAGTSEDVTMSWKTSVRLIAIPVSVNDRLDKFALEFITILNELNPSLDYVKDYCNRMRIPYQDTTEQNNAQERNNMQKRDSKGRFMKADKACGRGCKRKHDTCKCGKPADSVKDEGPHLPVDCSNMSDDELEQFIKTLITELANSVYIPGKTMTIDVAVEDNDDGTGTDEDAETLDVDAAKEHKENFMDSFRAFLRERGVELG